MAKPIHAAASSPDAAVATTQNAENLQAIWALAGIGLATWGAVEFDLPAQFKIEEEWIPFSAAAAVGGIGGYWLYFHRALVLTVSVIAALVYFQDPILDFFRDQGLLAGQGSA